MIVKRWSGNLATPSVAFRIFPTNGAGCYFGLKLSPVKLVCYKNECQRLCWITTNMTSNLHKLYDVDKRPAAGRLLLSANRPSVPVHVYLGQTDVNKPR